MITKELEKIAELHDNISYILGTEWGSGWWYEERSCAYHFHWIEDQHHCQSDVIGHSFVEALEHFEYLIQARKERLKVLKGITMPMLQRDEATENDIKDMKYWFSVNPGAYEKNYARMMSQNATKKISDLNNSELQRLHHLWKEYQSLKQE